MNAWAETSDAPIREVIECRCARLVAFVHGAAKLLELGTDKPHDEVKCAEREAERRGK